MPSQEKIWAARRLRDDDSDAEIAREGWRSHSPSSFSLKGFQPLVPRPRFHTGLTLAFSASFVRLHSGVRVGTDMKYLDGKRTEREKKGEEIKKKWKGEERYRARVARRRSRERSERIKKRETRTRRREDSLRAGWRRLDFISSCRFDVPDACRWPASAFLTNSSPRRPLISALRLVLVPIFISLPLYYARVYLTTCTRTRAYACACVC